LYFVARDGQILYEVAARIREAVGCDIELCYLYGSRQAWHLPAVAEITERETHWITVKDPFLSLRLIATRLSMDPSTLALHLRDSGFPRVDLDQDLSEQQVVQLRSLLLTSEELQALIRAEAEQRRQEVIAYLCQQGLLDESPWAIVDSGWNGRLQESLYKILHMAGRNGDVIGFYVGLLSKPCSYTSKLPYLFSPDVSPEYLVWGSAVINLLELVMSADHGITLSYRRDSSGIWHPVLATDTPDLMGSMGLAALREGVFSFLEHLDYKSVRIEHSRLREKIIRLLKVFYLAPSQDAAIALGRLPFSTDQTEKIFLPFAPSLSPKDAFHFALRSSSRERFALTFWIHGSRVQSSWMVNVFLSVTSLAYRCSRYVRKLIEDMHSKIQGALR
jgi:predicted HAD superfamily hydrolase